jgi:D-glucuronyl C5-epimerase C-terminus
LRACGRFSVNIQDGVVGLRQLSLAAATAALTVGAVVSAPTETTPAQAARVLEREIARPHREQAPAARLSDSKAAGLAARATGPVRAARATRTARKRKRDAVRRAVERAHLAGQISSEDRYRYLKGYQDAKRLLATLSGTRRRELAYVVETLDRIARAGRLKAVRMPALFLILQRNREWWGSKSAPASGARVRFDGSALLFQYYPGRGLQLQPLANFGLANGYWQGRKDPALRSLIDELVELRVKRGSFTAWEYYFHFGGGSPPWISGMAQATAMQALSRAAERLDDPELLAIARQGVGAFEQRTPVGVRVPAGSGAWYALYSFAPRLYVLNGMLQALIGLNTYVSYSGDERARALFGQGNDTARARIAAYDTGAWSLYSRFPGRPGPEADLNYHKLNRDFSRRLCNAIESSAYCDAADNFSRYLREPPKIKSHRAVPAPAAGGRGVKFRFELSKIGRVGIVVTDGASSTARRTGKRRVKGRAARTYLSTSAPFSRGGHFFRWVPPRLGSERTYTYKLFARDLAGNSSSATGTLRVKARSSR